jgi:hypothetical protein
MDLRRDGYRWRIKGDWLPQFPIPIQEQVHYSVLQLSEAILAGDEKRANEMARLWFPGIWEDSPGSIRRQLQNEIYALLFLIRKRAEGESSPDFGLLDAVQESLPRAVDELKGDYTLESLRAESEHRPGFAHLKFEQAVAEMDSVFSQAGLSSRELRVMRLQVVLAARGEQWPVEDKEGFLGMKPGTYGAALYRARQKLGRKDVGRIDSAHKRLLKAIFGDDSDEDS